MAITISSIDSSNNYKVSSLQNLKNKIYQFKLLNKMGYYEFYNRTQSEKIGCHVKSIKINFKSIENMLSNKDRIALRKNEILRNGTWNSNSVGVFIDKTLGTVTEVDEKIL